MIVALALVVAGGAWWWRASEAQAAVAAALPARPELHGFVPELAVRIEAAERRARGISSAIAGLSELALLYHANGFQTEAGDCERALLELDPANPLWPYLLAHTIGGYGDLEEAMPLLEQTIALAPDYATARIRLGDTLLKRNASAKAAAIYREVLSTQPGQGYAAIGLARTELAQGQVEAARQRLQRLVEEQPQFQPAWTLLIGIDEQLDEGKAAATRRRQPAHSGRLHEMPDPWIDELMTHSYDPYRLSVAAAAADPANNQARARQLLERAIAIAPTDDLPLRLLGNLLSDLGDLPAARRHLERAATINPKDPDNWSYLVRVLKGIGDLPAANRALDTGLTHCPEAAVLHIERGRRLASAGQLDGAAAAFALARKLRPDDSTASMELAGVLFKQNRLEQGVEELRNVVKIDPNHPVAVLLLARYAIANGEDQRAAEWIARARRQPQVPPGDLQRVQQEFRAQFGRLP